MKKSITLLLVLCMFVSLFSGMAFAADAAPETEDTIGTEPTDVSAAQAAEADVPAALSQAAESEEATAQSAFGAKLYVAANAAAGLDGEIAVQFSLTGGTLYLPGKADTAQLAFSWDDESITLSEGDVTYRSGEAPVANAGESVTYKVMNGRAVGAVTVKTVQGSADVEPMFLELDETMGTIAAMNGDDTHETICYGQAKFDGLQKAISIKGRGNSTWGFDKKPYNITFYKAKGGDPWGKKDKTELIPGVKAKKWSLLANYLDNSLLRNKIAMDLASALGIGLETRFVDVWMNGEYLGNYLMTPKNDYAAPDGGYALENDNYLEAEDPQFQIPGMYEIGAPIHDDGYYNRITVKDIGDDAADAGVDAAAIESYFTEAWNALENYQSEDYQKYFDLDSWAKMFLMYEVSKTYDCYAGSLLMHRDGLTEADKLIAGPAWDYDVAFGRTLHKFLVGVSEPIQLNAEGWYNDSIGLIAVDKPISLLQELGKHASFMRAVAKVFNDNGAVFADLPANVTRQQEILRASAQMNNALWGTNSLCADYLVAPNTMSLLGTGKYALHYEVTLTWDNYVNNLREYCAKRVLWLSDALAAAEAPAGSIVKKTMDNGTVVLQAVLTAGNGKNTYQWQSSADGETWTDIAGAADARFAPETDETGKTLYRCVVQNAGAVIYTAHGGRVPTYAETTLEPAAVTVRMAETALSAGELTLVLGGREMGEFTFAPFKGGWSIQNENGKYLTASGRLIFWSSEPMAWRLENGALTTTATLAVTGLGKLLTLGYLRDVSLTVSGGKLAVTTGSGATATFRAPVAD